MDHYSDEISLPKKVHCPHPIEVCLGLRAIANQALQFLNGQGPGVDSRLTPALRRIKQSLYMYSHLGMHALNCHSYRQGGSLIFDSDHPYKRLFCLSFVSNSLRLSFPLLPCLDLV